MQAGGKAIPSEFPIIIKELLCDKLLTQLKKKPQFKNFEAFFNLLYCFNEFLDCFHIFNIEEILQNERIPFRDSDYHRI